MCVHWSDFVDDTAKQDANKKVHAEQYHVAPKATETRKKNMKLERFL